MMLKILITGVGGPAAICVYKSLKKKGYQLFMADMDPLATGLFLVDPSKRFVIPSGTSIHFNKTILNLCKLHQIDILIPTVDSELIPLVKIKTDFDSINCHLMTSTEEVLNTVLDKLTLMNKCKGKVALPDFQSLENYLENPKIFSQKIVFKPRRGSGSRGVFIVETTDKEQLSKLPKDTYMVQEFINGKEYSIDIMLNINGSAVAAVARERLKTDSGVVIASKTLKNKIITDYAITIAKTTGIRYGANIQVMTNDKGEPLLLEINPRFSGGLSLTIKSGINIPSLCIDHIIFQKALSYRDYKEISMVRYYTEHFMPNSELNKYQKIEPNI